MIATTASARRRSACASGGGFDAGVFFYTSRTVRSPIPVQFHNLPGPVLISARSLPRPHRQRRGLLQTGLARTKSMASASVRHTPLQIRRVPTSKTTETYSTQNVVTVTVTRRQRTPTPRCHGCAQGRAPPRVHHLEVRHHGTSTRLTVQVTRESPASGSCCARHAAQSRYRRCV
jgi:hypothetical protein